MKVDIGGKSVMVDPLWEEEVKKAGWYFDGNYICRRTSMVRGKRSKVYLHRLILNATRGEVVDHINGDKLDNRINNLRKTDYSGNSHNRPAFNRNTFSRYKGVTKSNLMTNRFRARIYVRGKEISLRTYATEVEAAIAYNKAAVQYFGDFANLNKITL